MQPKHRELKWQVEKMDRTVLTTFDGETQLCRFPLLPSDPHKATQSTDIKPAYSNSREITSCAAVSTPQKNSLQGHSEKISPKFSRPA
jgi:hypothetical protein